LALDEEWRDHIFHWPIIYHYRSVHFILTFTFLSGSAIWHSYHTVPTILGWYFCDVIQNYLMEHRFVSAQQFTHESFRSTCNSSAFIQHMDCFTMVHIYLFLQIAQLHLWEPSPPPMFPWAIGELLIMLHQR
jgi:hypothetical protein